MMRQVYIDLRHLAEPVGRVICINRVGGRSREYIGVSPASARRIATFVRDCQLRGKLQSMRPWMSSSVGWQALVEEV